MSARGGKADLAVGWVQRRLKMDDPKRTCPTYRNWGCLCILLSVGNIVAPDALPEMFLRRTNTGHLSRRAFARNQSQVICRSLAKASGPLNPRRLSAA